MNTVHLRLSHDLKTPSLACLLAGCMTLAGCSDNGPTAGGSAGDSPFAAADAVALITPFEGLYQLPANWEGIDSDGAYLGIGLVDAFGVADATLYRFSQINNCIRSSTVGEVTKDPTQDRVFLDNLPALDQSVLSLDATGSSTELVIERAEDTADIDADGDTSEPVELRANKLAVMIDDIGEPCS